MAARLRAGQVVINGAPQNPAAPFHSLWFSGTSEGSRLRKTVIEYGGGRDRSALRADAMRFDAVLRNLELIGEAATHVPEAIRLAHPDIPWRLVIATRNRLIHGYLGIDEDTVWSIVSVDVPALRIRLSELLRTR